MACEPSIDSSHFICLLKYRGYTDDLFRSSHSFFSTQMKSSSNTSPGIGIWRICQVELDVFLSPRLHPCFTLSSLLSAWLQHPSDLPLAWLSSSFSYGTSSSSCVCSSGSSLITTTYLPGCCVTCSSLIRICSMECTAEWPLWRPSTSLLGLFCCLQRVLRWKVWRALEKLVSLTSSSLSCRLFWQHFRWVMMLMSDV